MLFVCGFMPMACAWLVLSEGPGEGVGRYKARTSVGWRIGEVWWMAATWLFMLLHACI